VGVAVSPNNAGTCWGSLFQLTAPFLKLLQQLDHNTHQDSSWLQSSYSAGRSGQQEMGSFSMELFPMFTAAREPCVMIKDWLS
jgi:hypothetical protein